MPPFLLEQLLLLLPAQNANKKKTHLLFSLFLLGVYHLLHKKHFSLFIFLPPTKKKP